MNDLSKKALKCTIKSWITVPVKIMQMIIHNYFVWPVLVWVTVICTILFTCDYQKVADYFFPVAVVGGGLVIIISIFFVSYQYHREMLMEKGEC